MLRVMVMTKVHGFLTFSFAGCGGPLTPRDLHDLATDRVPLILVIGIHIVSLRCEPDSHSGPNPGLQEL